MFSRQRTVVVASLGGSRVDAQPPRQVAASRILRACSSPRDRHLDAGADEDQRTGVTPVPWAEARRSRSDAVRATGTGHFSIPSTNGSLQDACQRVDRRDPGKHARYCNPERRDAFIAASLPPRTEAVAQTNRILTALVMVGERRPLTCHTDSSSQFLGG